MTRCACGRTDPGGCEVRGCYWPRTDAASSVSAGTKFRCERCGAVLAAVSAGAEHERGEVLVIDGSEGAECPVYSMPAPMCGSTSSEGTSSYQPVAAAARLAALEDAAEAARALREHLANVEPIRFKFDPVTLVCPGCDVWNALLDALAAVDAQEPNA